VHEKSRRQIAERVLAVSSLVFWAFVSWILIIVAGRMARRMVKRINAMEGKVGALELHQVELLPAAAGREALRMLVYVALWVVRVGLVYVWVLGALSLSPATQAHAKSATAYLFAPALDLVVQLASRLPLLIALLLAFLVVSFVVRFVMVYSRAIERGEIESEWVRPETARTSGTLLVVALCLSTLLFLTPILAGSADGSLPRMGLLGLGAVALGATPLLGSGGRAISSSMEASAGALNNSDFSRSRCVARTALSSASHT
jgi:hypothetical protein